MLEESVEYLSIAKIAEIWNISSRRIQILCSSGRINNAIKTGRTWAIPKNTPKPDDARKKRKKYTEINSDKQKHINTNSLKLEAIITAGGNYKKQNDISPLFKIGNISLIKRIVITLQQAGITNIVVTGYRNWEIEHHLVNYGVVFLHNDSHDVSDKFTSSKIGLNFLINKCDKFFLTSLKIPMFMPDTLKAMIEYKHPIVIPQYQGKNGHPLLLDKTIISDIINYQGDDGMRGAVKNCSCKKKILTVSDEGILLSTSNIAYLEENIEKRDEYLLRPYIQIKIKKSSNIFDERAKLLLFLIKEFHSVQNACKQMALSKSKAWEMIATMEKELGFIMIERQQGGSKNRKTKLTLEGEEFLYFFEDYEKNIKNYADKYFQKAYKIFIKNIKKSR